MSVVVCDENGNLHKKMYFKDGYPQKVFKDDKLIFPDFCMVNSGGHNGYDEMPYKSTIYGDADSLGGFNNLFQPYSSKTTITRMNPLPIGFNEYYTDSVVYGEGCKLSDTCNLCVETNIQPIGRLNGYNLSACGDCIIIEGEKLREYMSQLTYSSNSFLYCKISADTDSIDGYIREHNINSADVDWDNSYDPKMTFGIQYGFTGYDGGRIAVRGNNNGSTPPNVKLYKRANGSSNKIDIECVLNYNDSIYCGYTNKYFVGNRNKEISEDMDSMICRPTIMCHDKQSTLSSYDRSKYIILPNFEYHEGLIKWTENGDVKSAPLYIKKACSGEWGASFDKATPKEITLCENLNGDLYTLENSRQNIFGNGNAFNTAFNGETNNLVTNSSVYPLNQQFHRDFYDYMVENGIIKTSTLGTFPSAFPVNIFPDYNDYLSGYSTYGSPSYLDVPSVDIVPSSGINVITDKNNDNLDVTDNISKDSAFETVGGVLLSGFFRSYMGNLNYNSKMLVKTEFDARLKFETSENHQLPIVIGTNKNDYKDGGNSVNNVYDESVYLPKHYNKNIKNLCGESDYDWTVTNEWRHYCYTAETTYSNNSSVDISGDYVGRRNGILVPYLTLYGNSYQIQNVQNEKGYMIVTPYEVRNVTTKIYI